MRLRTPWPGWLHTVSARFELQAAMSTLAREVGDDLSIAAELARPFGDQLRAPAASLSAQRRYMRRRSPAKRAALVPSRTPARVRECRRRVRGILRHEERLQRLEARFQAEGVRFSEVFLGEGTEAASSSPSNGARHRRSWPRAADQRSKASTIGCSSAYSRDAFVNRAASLAISGSAMCAAGSSIADARP